MKKALKIILIVLISLLALTLIVAALNYFNSLSLKKYIDTFSKVEYTSQLNVEYDELGTATFTTDGQFKVMHLTDVHLTGGFIAKEKDKMVINALAAMVSTEKPDLVIISGDMSFAVPWHGSINNYYAHSSLIRLMERLGVYWTVTLGNHDSESYNIFDRESVGGFYSDESLKYCLFKNGPEKVEGVGNHLINVKGTNGLIRKSIVMIDSGEYTDDDPLGIKWLYENVSDSQIDWYKQTINTYKEKNTSTFDSLPEEFRQANPDAKDFEHFIFMHIPTTEVKLAYDEYVNNGRQNTEDVTYIGGNDGESDKVVFCPVEDDMLFESALESGCCEAIFYGHDHLNNFVLEYKGITLSYGYSLDYSAYAGIAGKGYQRGCAVITIGQTDEISITHENYYQDKYVPLYEKETVDMSK